MQQTLAAQLSSSGVVLIEHGVEHKHEGSLCLLEL
jgi:hypothetical protein